MNKTAPSGDGGLGGVSKPDGMGGLRTGVRANWREIDVVDLTDEEVAQMSPAEERWCLDLLHQRYLRSAAPAEPAPEPEPTAAAAIDPADIDKAEIAVMDSGVRLWVYPGEGGTPDSFAGEIINPTERQMRGQGHVSCLWDRSKVIALENTRTSSPGSGDDRD